MDFKSEYGYNSGTVIATVTFDRTDEAPDWTVVDTIDLQEAVMIALGRHFCGYDRAAEAQQDYRRVVAGIKTNAPHLFGTAEAMRAGLAAHPDALEWSAFEKEAAADIAPFRFSIRFPG